MEAILRRILRNARYDRIRVSYHFFQEVVSNNWESSFIAMLYERVIAAVNQVGRRGMKNGKQPEVGEPGVYG